MSGYTLKHGRAATPAPVDPRYTRLKELAKALEKEAKVHRDDADTLERFGDLMQDRDRLVRSWVARAKAFKRRALARDLFGLAWKLDGRVCATEEEIQRYITERQRAETGERRAEMAGDLYYGLRECLESVKDTLRGEPWTQGDLQGAHRRARSGREGVPHDHDVVHVGVRHGRGCIVRYRTIEAGDTGVTIIVDGSTVWVAATVAGKCMSALGIRRGRLLDATTHQEIERSPMRWRPCFWRTRTTGPAKYGDYVHNWWTWLAFIVNEVQMGIIRSGSSLRYHWHENHEPDTKARLLAGKIRRYLAATYCNG